jgi:hypothetical protein
MEDLPMQITIGKILGLVIAILYVVFACLHQGVTGLKYSVSLLLPLALIWFPEEIGSVTGYFRTGYINVQTPGIMVSFMGWFFLVGLPALFYLIVK